MSPDFEAPGDAVLSADGRALEVVESVGPNGEIGSRFKTLPEFVEEFITTTWIRDTGGVHWCAWWWRHMEAQVRLEALWSVYEAARVAEGPSAMAEFLRIELDHHMAVLTSPGGPFCRCDYRRGMHSVQEPWPVEQPPAGLFRPEPPPTQTDTTETDTGREEL